MIKGFTNIILIAIIGILVFLLVIRSGRNPERDISREIALQRKYDSSQIAIDSLKNNIAHYKDAIINLNSYDKSLVEQYKNKKNEINNLQKELDAKNHIVELLNCAQLESELTSRYDSTKR
jgi:hypothetical protein